MEKAIPAEMLSSQVPHDVRRFCPNFYHLNDTDKRVFWAYFFQALAGAEAGLNPTTRIRHTQPEVAKIDEVSGRAVRSEGLLQLTYEDAKRYNCDFDWEKDRELSSKDPAKTILQPKNNLECGMKILDNQIITQHKRLAIAVLLLVDFAAENGKLSRFRQGNDEPTRGVRAASAHDHCRLQTSQECDHGFRA